MGDMAIPSNKLSLGQIRNDVASKLKTLQGITEDQRKIIEKLASKLYVPEAAQDAIDLVQGAYSKFISKMLASRIQPEDIADDIGSAITKLEDQVNILYDENQCNFMQICSRPAIQKWICDTAIEQIKKGGINSANKDKDITDQCMIGDKEFGVFMKAIKAGTIGKINYNKLMGEGKLSLREFVKKMRNEVMVSCEGNASTMVEMFNKKNVVILMKRSDMADTIKGTLIRIITAKINFDYPQPDDKGKDVNEDTRKSLLENMNKYIQNGEIENLSKNEDVKDGKGNKTAYDYLGRLQKTTLYYFIRTYSFQTKTRAKDFLDPNNIMKPEFVQNMYADAGFAIFRNDKTDNLEAEYVKDGGEQSDFNKFNFNDDYVGKWFRDEIADFGARGPRYPNYRLHIKEIYKLSKGPRDKFEDAVKKLEEVPSSEPKDTESNKTGKDMLPIGVTSKETQQGAKK